MSNGRVVNGIHTVVISGRDYVTCAERIRIVHERKKEFDILESEPRHYGDRWVWRVVVRIDGHQYIGSAEVHTNAKPGSADATDCWAVAETSAVARALAFAGLGTVESLASYEEIFRGQPAMTIVEAQTPRLASPQQQNHEHKARLNTLYQKAQEMGAIEKGLGKQEGAAAFLKWASEILEAQIASVEQLTASRLETLEAFLSAKDAA